LNRNAKNWSHEKWGRPFFTNLLKDLSNRWQLQLNRCHLNFLIVKTRKVLLKGKAQYSWPPCTN
jgi:hypothetical protein